MRSRSNIDTIFDAIAGVGPGNWISGWINVQGDIVHGLGKSWSHHPDLLDDNLWLMKEAGIPEDEYEDVLNGIASLSNSTLHRLARGGLFTFVIERDGKINFDIKPPKDVADKLLKQIEVLRDSLPTEAETAE